MKRRDFIHKLSHAAASPFVLPPFVSDLRFAHPNSILNNTAQQGNIIVLIKLNGGNDGLNTVIPLDQYAPLRNARPHVILPENRIISLGDHDLGLHPSLTNFKSLYDEGRMKIIQNVGYENPDFSHFRSMDILGNGEQIQTSTSILDGWGVLLKTNTQAFHAIIRITIILIHYRSRLAARHCCLPANLRSLVILLQDRSISRNHQ